jgi:hypothetical protein
MMMVIDASVGTTEAFNQLMARQLQLGEDAYDGVRDSVLNLKADTRAFCAETYKKQDPASSAAKM